MKKFVWSVVAMLLIAPAWAEDGNTVVAGPENASEVRITVYDDDLAAIRETHNVSLPAGISTVEFFNISGQIMPETALLQGGDVEIIEQNFDFDLLTPEKILEKAVGQDIRLKRTNPATGTATYETATVLSANGGTVLRFNDRIEILGHGGLPERMQFGEIPPNLKPVPTLTTEVESEGGFDGGLSLSYLTGGFAWEAEYVFQLNDQETAVDIQAWVTVTNETGTNFENVKLMLLAGEIHRAYRPVARGFIEYDDDEEAVEEVTVTGSRVPQQLADYHLYTMSEGTSLLNNQEKKLALFTADQIPIAKTYQFILETPYYFDTDGEANEIESATIHYVFENTKENGIGLPIPGGWVTFYMRDREGQNHFLYEDDISNTPENDEVEFFIEEAFDVTAVQRVVKYKERRRKLPGAVERLDTELYGVEVVFNNATSSDQIVEFTSESFVEEFYEIIEEDALHEAGWLGTPTWNITVPAKSQMIFHYTVEIEE